MAYRRKRSNMLRGARDSNVRSAVYWVSSYCSTRPWLCWRRQREKHGRYGDPYKSDHLLHKARLLSLSLSLSYLNSAIVIHRGAPQDWRRARIATMSMSNPDSGSNRGGYKNFRQIIRDSELSVSLPSRNSDFLIDFWKCFNNFEKGHLMMNFHTCMQLNAWNSHLPPALPKKEILGLWIAQLMVSSILHRLVILSSGPMRMISWELKNRVVCI